MKSAAAVILSGIFAMINAIQLTEGSLLAQLEQILPRGGPMGPIKLDDEMIQS